MVLDGALLTVQQQQNVTILADQLTHADIILRDDNFRVKVLKELKLKLKCIKEVELGPGHSALRSSLPQLMLTSQRTHTLAPTRRPPSTEP